MKIKRDLIQPELVVQLGQTPPALRRGADHGPLFELVGHGPNELQKGFERVVILHPVHQFGRHERGEQIGIGADRLAALTNGNVVVGIDQQPEDEGHPFLSMAVLGEQAPVALNTLSDLGVGAGQPRHDKRVVAGNGGALVGLGTDRPPVDRRVGLLDRLGTQRQGRHLPELALVFDRVLGPGPPDDLQRLLIARPALPHLDPKALKVLLNNAATHPKIQPPVTQDIEHGKVFGFAQRAVKRQQADGGAQTNAGRFPGQRGQKQLGAGTDPEGIKMLLAKPHRVKAELLGRNGDVERVAVVLDLVLAIREEVKQGE